MANGFFSGLLDILFPPKCVFCRSVLKAGEVDICASCSDCLPVNEGGFVRLESESVNRCVAPLYYKGDVRQSLLRFKFKGATQYASCYGRLLASCIASRIKGQYDLISWVPLSRQREKKRGYNQAMLLAMATALELDDVAVELLKKSQHTQAQSGLDGAAERRENVKGVFSVADAELVAGKRILLIDDIVTTGSTLSECARVLRQAGAEAVYCAALACTPPPSMKL